MQLRCLQVESNLTICPRTDTRLKFGYPCFALNWVWGFLYAGFTFKRQDEPGVQNVTCEGHDRPVQKVLVFLGNILINNVSQQPSNFSGRPFVFFFLVSYQIEAEIFIVPPFDCTHCLRMVSARHCSRVCEHLL